MSNQQIICIIFFPHLDFFCFFSRRLANEGNQGNAGNIRQQFLRQVESVELVLKDEDTYIVQDDQGKVFEIVPCILYQYSGSPFIVDMNSS